VEAAMTDDSVGFDDGADNDADDGADSHAAEPAGAGFDNADAEHVDFDHAFFASPETGPDEEPTEVVAEDLVPDEAIDLEGEGGVDEFLYEAEGDGSFETEAAEFDADDFPFDLGGEA
jgi:hypothetical protein